MSDFDRSDVIAALRETDGDVGAAAKRLGCARRTLQNRMREYGLRHLDGGPARGAGRPKHRLRRQPRVGGLVAGAALTLGALVAAGKLGRS